MKRQLFFLLVSCFIFVSNLNASDDRLEVGKKVPAWLFSGDEKDYSLDSWPGRIAIANYVDPRFPDQGDEVADALKNAVLDRKLSLKLYQPVAIINCDTTWQPNFLIRYKARQAADKLTVLKPILLFDYDRIIEKNSTLKNEKDATCFILIDKKGVCRAIYKGKLSKNQIDEMINLAEVMQNEPENS